MTQKTVLARDRTMIDRSLQLDLKATQSEIVDFVKRVFKESGATGIVVGLSGGIDSAVTAKICAMAVGPGRVTGFLLFERKNMTGEDARHARGLARALGIKTHEFILDEVVEPFLTGFPIKSKEKVSVGNLKARTRMVSLYFAANALNLLVAGTGDKSEDLIGYFTKYGDGGVDFLPIAHLYKTQVRKLGSFLGLPREIVEKPSSPNLWDGHKATDEIPLDYETMDPVLVALFDLKMDPREVGAVLEVENAKIHEIVQRHRASAHKRAYPPMIGGW